MEGLGNDSYRAVGLYELMLERKAVNRRAAWQKQGGNEEEWFLYYSAGGEFVASIEHWQLQWRY